MPSSFLPLTRPEIDEATIAMVADVLRSGWITSGPQVLAFESKLSTFFGNRPVRCFANGTATMEVALRIAGIGPGDEVITTPISWVATANVILAVGATPVFADIDPLTRNISIASIKRAITPRTKAFLPVHLAGLPVDMDALYALAKEHHIRVIEDAAQAIGATWKGQRIGQLGDLVSISFQANKNITSAEGGCLILNNDEEVYLAEKLRLQGLVRQGMDGMEVDIVGGKHNLSDVHAAIGLGQFAQLERFQAQRTQLAQHYFDRFANSLAVKQGMQLPPAHNSTDGSSNWHLFQVSLPLEILKQSRADIMQQLKNVGIGSGVHYPPIHLFKLYRMRGFTSGMYPVAEHIGERILSLPLFSSMTTTDVDHVTDVVDTLFRAHI
ncbi:MAG: DegT/DnrJ/EryC1/StrS aminotransferase family protein [Ottowia sp.]|nr:DegT/DnrJ/EryC1/StrS aminotransferase family protein [Ottowia sp.]